MFTWSKFGTVVTEYEETAPGLLAAIAKSDEMNPKALSGQPIGPAMPERLTEFAGSTNTLSITDPEVRFKVDFSKPYRNAISIISCSLMDG